MPQLAVFPKAFMQELCKDGTMKVSEWINLAVELEVDGLEWYAGFLEMADRSNWAILREQVERRGKTIPMLCCSPDITHPYADFRSNEITNHIGWIVMIHALGCSYCRVLFGQGGPELTSEEGVGFAADCIKACVPVAKKLGVTLIL